ncbi:MAG: molybdopterin-binding protein [Hyphomicrobium sp.]|nr:molybdopterin-binding protein [Hyphomicrobium sp.]
MPNDEMPNDEQPDSEEVAKLAAGERDTATSGGTDPFDVQAIDVTAAILVIGDEILSGRTKDKNIGHIADHLTRIGIALREVRIVPDDEMAIVSAVNALRTAYDYVFTTGGIGPTHDDITADCVAKAFGVPIDVDPRALDIMRPAYAKRGIELNAARLRMARIPEGADIVANSVTMAPGFRLGNVIVMAGVPAIMQSMLEAVTPVLRTGNRVFSITLKALHAEGEIADLFAAHQSRWPRVAMGSYPGFAAGQFWTELVLRSAEKNDLEAAAASLEDALSAAGLRADRIAARTD